MNSVFYIRISTVSILLRLEQEVCLNALSDDGFEKDNQAFANYSSSLPSLVFVTEPEEKHTHFIIYDSN